ncbi:MAG: serine hydrolase [Candidatus Omnitrophota bacterium]
MKFFRSRSGIIFTGLLAFVFLFCSDTFAAKKKSKAHRVTARSAIFSNSTKGVRLYGKNVETTVVPASTTKVMTALLVLENLSLDSVVTVSSRATYVQPSKIYLKPGERYKVSELLYAMLISSANDASVVLAEAVSGSEWEFVKKMNARAKQLGAKKTKFMNSHGLPTKQSQYTTAYDMYLMFREALKYPFFKKALSYKYKTIVSQSGKKTYLKNHNKLLWKSWGQNIYGKTGYTRKARSCFVGYLDGKKDTMIIAVFGCDQRWDDIKTIVARYIHSR